MNEPRPTTISARPCETRSSVAKFWKTRTGSAELRTFFFMRDMLQHDLDWYQAHFQSENGGEPKPERGEISPVYGRLKGWQVNRIAKLLPDLRVVLTLRHPIERVWSQALLEAGYLKGKDLRKIRAIDFMRQVERSSQQSLLGHCRTIQIWSKAFGWDALHAAKFDQLQNDPEAYVNDILRHIGAATPWSIPEKFMKTKVHATSSLVHHQRDIPEWSNGTLRTGCWGRPNA